VIAVTSRLIELLRRLTAAERVAVAVVAMSPVVVLSALVVGVLLDTALLTALIVIGWYVATVVLVTALLSMRLARRRAVLNRTAVTEADGAQLALPGQLERTARSERLAVVRAYAAGRSLDATQLFAARSGSMWVRDVYASRLSRGRLDWESFALFLRAAGSDRQFWKTVIGTPDAAVLTNLSRTLASQGAQDGALATVLDYLARSDLSRVPRQDRLQLAERFMFTGRTDSARSVLDGSPAQSLSEQLLAADLINPFHANGSSEGSKTWRAVVNGIFLPLGMEPIALGSGDQPFDRLRARAEDVVDGMQKVTIIMSCYRPGAGIFTAIRSIIAQTWQNWELLVMDDGSPAEFDELFDRVRRLDRRIRVIRSATNDGTYARRNDGIIAARGDVVTMHDSDDWAHPRRIELQMEHLLDNPQMPANFSRSLRVSEELRFVQARRIGLRPTEASLLFWRDRVVDRIGFYDTVRKAADSEFRFRIEAAFDVTVPLIGPEAPLQFIRYTPESLSGGEISDGWMHPARVAYRSGTEDWHRRIRTKAADPRLSYPDAARPFPVPHHLLGLPPQEHDLDVLVVLDGRERANPKGLVHRIAAELEQLATNGTRVGVWHVDAFSKDRSLGLFPPSLQALVTSGRVTRVLPGDPTRASRVVVRNISVLQGALPASTSVETSEVVLVEDLVSGRDVRGRDFALVDVQDVVRSWYGLEGQVVTLDGELDYTAAPAGGDHPTPRTRVGREDSAAETELLSITRPTGAIPEPTSYAATSRTLLTLAQLVRSLTSGVVVEAGSGYSTMWMALAAERANSAVRIISLEHEREFAEQTKELLTAQGVSRHAEVRYAPLEDVDVDGMTRQWYAASTWSDIDRIDLLFVDGPPEKTGAMARYPALPLLRHALRDGSHVLLDDANRDDEFATLREWVSADDGRGRLEVVSMIGRTALLRYRVTGG
jgi:predicted O-methyltransferase YrrM